MTHSAYHARMAYHLALFCRVIYAAPSLFVGRKCSARHFFRFLTRKPAVKFHDRRAFLKVGVERISLQLIAGQGGPDRHDCYPNSEGLT